MIEVIALDLDGTLLRGDGTVGERTLGVLDECRRKGRRIVFASARPPRAITEVLPAAFRDDPWICYNGAEVYQGKERLLQKALEPETARRVLRSVLERDPGRRLSLEIDDRLFANRALPTTWVYQIADLFAAAVRPVAKILVDLRPGDGAALLAGLPEGCQAVITDGGDLAQIAATGVSKTSGLVFLLDRWGHALAEVVAFGDDVNDLEMLRESGLGVAMGNAVGEVKAVAKRITNTNDEDGVAVVLEELIARDLAIPPIQEERG